MKTLDALLTENARQRTALTNRVSTLARRRQELLEEVRRLEEEAQRSGEEQRQLPAEEDLYWQHQKENAERLQERSQAVAGWKSTAAKDQRLIDLYTANSDLFANHPSVQQDYNAAVQRKKAIKEPVVAEIALRMVPYGDGESYVLTLPVPLDAEEGLAGAIRNHVVDVLEQNDVKVKNRRSNGLQSYTLLSINPRCHPEKLEELLNDLLERVPEELQEANVQVVVSDVRNLLLGSAERPSQKRETVLDVENTSGVPEGYIPATDPSVHEITGLQKTSLYVYLDRKGGPIKTFQRFDPSIGRNRLYVQKASLDGVVKLRGGTQGRVTPQIRIPEAPEGYIHIKDARIREITGVGETAIYNYLRDGEIPIKVRRISWPGKRRKFLYLEEKSLTAFAQSQGRAVPDEAEQQRSYHTIDDVFGEREYFTLQEGAALFGWDASTFYRKGDEAYIDCKDGPIKTVVGEAAQGKIAGLRLRSDARLLDRDSLLQFAKKQKIPANELYTEQEAVDYILSTASNGKKNSVNPNELRKVLHDEGVRTLTDRDGTTYYSRPVLSAILRRVYPEAYQ